MPLLPTTPPSNCHLAETTGIGEGDPRYDQRALVELFADFLLNKVEQASDQSRSLVVRFAKQLVNNAIVFAEKQADYGPGNISAFGEMGVLVRLSDKVARLRHLQGKVAKNESIQDTWLDIANYGAIAQMVRNGEWAGCEQKHLLCPAVADENLSGDSSPAREA